MERRRKEEGGREDTAMQLVRKRKSNVDLLKVIMKEKKNINLFELS